MDPVPDGEARQRLQAALDLSLGMNPLTPDHHFYIDQGTNARLRLVLVAIGRALVREGRLDDPEDVMFLRYQELRAFMADGDALPARDLVSERRDARDAAFAIRPREWLGTATQAALDFPYLTLWGFPEKFHREPPTTQTELRGLAASPGVVEGPARIVESLEDFDTVQNGDVLVCKMTNPAWVVLFTKIAGLVTDAGGVASHPAVVAREFAHPGGGRHLDRHAGDQDGRPRARQRRHRHGRDPRVIERPVLRDRVKDVLLERIVSGALPAGRAPGRDPHRPGARHEPGAGARGAARPRAARPGGARGVPGLLGARGLGGRAARGVPRAGRARGPRRAPGRAAHRRRRPRPASTRWSRRWPRPRAPATRWPSRTPTPPSTAPSSRPPATRRSCASGRCSSPSPART